MDKCVYKGTYVCVCINTESKMHMYTDKYIHSNTNILITQMQTNILPF